MICQTIRIQIRNAWEISQPARKAKLKLKELDNCQVGDQWPVSDEIHSQKRSFLTSYYVLKFIILVAF